MNLLEGEMAFIGEDTRVSKSTRRIELADESKAISCAKGATFFFQKEKQRAYHREKTVRENDLFGLNQKLSVFRGTTGDTVDDPFHSDPIVTDEPGNMGWGMIRVKIEVDRKDSQSKEKSGDDPESPSGFFQDRQQDPEAEEN